MSFKVRQRGGMVIFKLEWAYPESLHGSAIYHRPPNDVHVDVGVVDKNGKRQWKPLIGYDKIPDSINPEHPFELQVSKSNPLLKGGGEMWFRVRWTYWGTVEHIDWPETLKITTQR